MGSTLVPFTIMILAIGKCKQNFIHVFFAMLTTSSLRQHFHRLLFMRCVASNSYRQQKNMKAKCEGEEDIEDDEEEEEDDGDSINTSSRASYDDDLYHATPKPYFEAYQHGNSSRRTSTKPPHTVSTSKESNGIPLKITLRKSCASVAPMVAEMRAVLTSPPNGYGDITDGDSIRVANDHMSVDPDSRSISHQQPSNQTDQSRVHTSTKGKGKDTKLSSSIACQGPKSVHKHRLSGDCAEDDQMKPSVKQRKVAINGEGRCIVTLKLASEALKGSLDHADLAGKPHVQTVADATAMRSASGRSDTVVRSNSICGSDRSSHLPMREHTSSDGTQVADGYHDTTQLPTSSACQKSNDASSPQDSEVDHRPSDVIDGEHCTACPSEETTCTQPTKVIQDRSATAQDSHHTQRFRHSYKTQSIAPRSPASQYDFDVHQQRASGHGGLSSRSVVIDLTEQHEGSDIDHSRGYEASTTHDGDENESCVDTDATITKNGTSTDRGLGVYPGTSEVASSNCDGAVAIKVESHEDSGQVNQVLSTGAGTVSQACTAGADPSQPNAVGPAEAMSMIVTANQDSAQTDSSLVKLEAREVSEKTEKQPTALEKARLKVIWDARSDCPSFINLRKCRSYQDLFAQLEHHRPPTLKGNRIKAAEIVLVNAVEAGIAESPNCRLLLDDGEEAFDHLTDVLKGYTPDIRPKLRLVVEYLE